MNLRKQFESELKSQNIELLFEASNKKYIEWLERKVDILQQNRLALSYDNGFIRKGLKDLYRFSKDLANSNSDLLEIAKHYIKNHDYVVIEKAERLLKSYNNYTDTKIK